jgi:hypothetical protein
MHRNRWLDAQAPTHRPNPELVTMLGNKRVSHFASLAKYAVAFLNSHIWLWWDLQQREAEGLGASLQIADDGLCALFGHRFTVATTTASVSGVVQSGWPSRRSIFVNRTGNILRSPLQKGRHDGRP